MTNHAPQDRIDMLKTIQGAFPDLSLDDAVRTVEWAMTGNVALDPKRVDKAAEALAGTLGRSWASRETQNEMRGITQAVITAYLMK